MIKSVTLRAEDVLIQRVKEKAYREHKSMNELFREWMKRYVSKGSPEKDFNDFMNHASYANAGRKFSRDEMNER